MEKASAGYITMVFTADDLEKTYEEIKILIPLNCARPVGAARSWF